MGTVRKFAADRSAETPVRELLYTLCPVLVASNVALELGWIHDELAKVGASPTYLRSLADATAWKPHYDHTSDRLLRDGGNSPAIWAKADIRPTVLVGLTQAQPGGTVVVRAESRFYRVADLKGARFGLYRSRQTDKIDFRRATTHHGILSALALHGLTAEDVQWVDVFDADSHDETPAATPAGIWNQRHAHADRVAGVSLTPEARALLEGRVDALFDYTIGTAQQLAATGLFKIIEDLDRHPDWTLRIANAPRTITVSAEFAERHRDVVVAFLRASIRAGRWINANPDAAAAIFHRTTIYPDEREIARLLRGYDLVPNLSPQNLAGLSIAKDFLRDHGYVKNDVAVYDWADASFLEEALRS